MSEYFDTCEEKIHIYLLLKTYFLGSLEIRGKKVETFDFFYTIPVNLCQTLYYKASPINLVQKITISFLTDSLQGG